MSGEHHYLEFGRHPSAPIWTWRCSCGARLTDRLMGAYVSFLPSFAEAAARAEIHLVAVDAEIVRELLKP